MFFNNLIVLVATLTLVAVALPYGVNADSYPYLVSIRAVKKHECVGAIVGKQHVVTSASCVAYYKHTAADVLDVVTGEPNPDAAGIPVEKVIFYENPESHKPMSAWYYLAVVKTKDEFVFDDKVSSVNLASTTLSGGQTGVQVAFDNNNKQHVAEVKIKNKEKCQEYTELKIQNRDVFCAYNPTPTLNCFRSYGALLVSNNELFGVLPFENSCENGDPEVYINVADQVGFINSATSS